MLFISPQDDIVDVLQYINDYTAAIGIKDVDINVNTVSTIIAVAKNDGHYPGGAAKASAFRKVASFIAYFVALRPIINAFPMDKIGEQLYRINNHQNAILALAIAMDSLHGATIYRNDGEFVLTNPLIISSHSYVDIVDAISDVIPSIGMKLAAVLLEQIAYRFNPDCEYKLNSKNK